MGASLEESEEAPRKGKGRSPSSQPQLGERLRFIRHSRRRSLGEVADATGISASFLSLVETGRSDITISRLMKLVHYYGASVVDLLGPNPTNPMIVRREEQHHLASRGEGIEVALLAPDTSRTMLPILVTYEAGGQQAEPALSAGEAFLHVISGTIWLLIDGEEPITLSAGDSAYFTPNRPRRYENRGKTTARMIVCVTPPQL
jgi:transcriptional regulator with XRE-family HTH domain